MGLWADVIKVMKSGKFKELLLDGDYTISTTNTMQLNDISQLNEMASSTTVAFTAYPDVAIGDKTLPAYSKGIAVKASESVSLIAVDATGNMYWAFISQEGAELHKIVENSFIARDGTAVNLANNFQYLSSNGGTL